MPRSLLNRSHQESCVVNPLCCLPPQPAPAPAPSPCPSEHEGPYLEQRVLLLEQTSARRDQDVNSLLSSVQQLQAFAVALIRPY